MECKVNRLQGAEHPRLLYRAEYTLLSHFPHMMPGHQGAEAVYKHSSMGKIPHVGIVGAGLAGLRCADILIQNGIRATILEARNRIGGRVYQEKTGGHLVDFGANWIHGTKNNPIAEIGKLSGTTTHEPGNRQSVFSTSGQLHDEKSLTRISECLWKIMDQAFEYSRKNKMNIPADRSLLDFFKEKLETVNLDQNEKEACLEMSRIWGSYVGDSIQRQSLRFLHLEECIEGNNVFVASTYKNILKHVANSAVQHGCIKLNNAVVDIEAQNRNPGAEARVSVKTASGTEYVFDEVVVTCPLGWLKQNKPIFRPCLPPRLSKAIDSISYGRLEKVYVTFPTAFWHNAPQSIPNANGIAARKCSKQQDNCQKGSPQNPPSNSLFLSPSYVEPPADIPWNQECVSLADLPTDCAHPTLLFYLYGCCATYIMAQIKSLDPASDAYYAKLNGFLQPYFSRLPHYDAASESCKPTAFLATQWQNDPWAGNGSYCNFQVGLEDGCGDIRAMREGMGLDRGVWFAGEHTSPFVALGTTTGAYWSGELVAGRISLYYGKENKGGEVVGETDVRPSSSINGVNGVNGPVNGGGNDDSAAQNGESDAMNPSTQTYTANGSVNGNDHGSSKGNGIGNGANGEPIV